MATEVLCLPATCTVATVSVALSRSSHNAFPIMDVDGIFCGMSHRDTLLAILADLAGSATTAPGIDLTLKKSRRKTSAKSRKPSNFEPEDYLPSKEEVKSLVSNTEITPVPELTEEKLLDALTPQQESSRFAGQKSYRRNSITRVAQSVTKNLSAETRLRPIVLTKLMDPSPFTVHESLPLDRAHRLFTSQGLRQLAVTDAQRKVVGIITRADLFEASLQD